MALFKSKLGLIAATVGSAVGLGSVWRFPAEVQGNGGAAFLIVYIVFAFVLGVPVMLSEFALGRGTHSDAVTSFKILRPNTGWWGFGAFAALASFLIMCFYMVVGGWTLEYFVESLNGGLYGGLSELSDVGARDVYFQQKMQQYVMTDWAPVLYTLAFVALNLIVLLGGVAKGIERMSNLAMPLLFVLLLVFCCVSLSLPGSSEGVRFFLEPDFSKITPTVLINALGQALFSLSLGMGILITYSAYYPNDTRLGRTSAIVVSLTLLVAVLMGLLIFPAVSSFGLTDHGLSGTTLVFQTLPEVFQNLPGTVVWSALFFLLLIIAALTSTVSLAEVIVLFLNEHFHIRRTPAVLISLLPIFVLAGVCALSFGPLADIKICGMVIFDALDNFTSNYMLPIAAFGTCLFMGWFVPRDFMYGELSNHGTIRSWLNTTAVFIVRWLAPIAIFVILMSNII